MNPKQALPRIALVIAALGWGSSPVATRFLSSDQNFWMLLTFRFAPSLVVIGLIYIFLRKIPKIDNWNIWSVLAVSLIGGLGYNGFVTAALYVSAATPVGIALTSEPLWILLLEAIFVSRVFTKSMIVGMLLAFLGTIIATVTSSHGGSNVLLGVVLAMLGTFCWAIYTVWGANWRANSFDKTAFMVLFSTPVSVIGALIIGFQVSSVHMMASGWIAVLALSLGSTVIAMTFWNYGAHGLGPRLSAPFLYLQPISTIGLSILLLGESINILQLGGLLVIVIGLVISQRDVAIG